MIEKLEADLAGVVKAIEQAFANVNILNGQKQGLEHALTTIKAAAGATESAVSAVEGVIEPAVSAESTFSQPEPAPVLADAVKS